LIKVRDFLLRLWGLLIDRVGVKAIRYTAISAISVVLSQVILFLLYGVMRLSSATTSNVIATGVTAVPSYYLNRSWAWGKTGRSHLMKEVAPFWFLTFLGLVLSLWAVSLAHHLAVNMQLSHLVDALFVNAASLLAFGVLWIGKFIIFNRFVFTTPDSSVGVEGSCGSGEE
jgi:putative flippase GtrA